MKYRVMVGTTLADLNQFPDWEYGAYSRRWRAQLVAWIYNLVWGYFAVAYVEEVGS